MTVDDMVTRCYSIDCLEIRNSDNEIFEGVFNAVMYYEVLHYKLEVCEDSRIKMIIWI